MVRVDSISKLQGWRGADVEELKVIQGLLLQEAKLREKSGGAKNIFFVIFSYLSFVGAWNILKYLITSFGEETISDIIMLVAILIILLFIGVFLGVSLIKSVSGKSVMSYHKAIEKNNIRVNEVEIYEVISLRGVGNGTDGHRVKVKDIFDTYCEENIIFECCNGYKETKALLFEVTISENSNGAVSRKCVIPCKEYDPKIWNIGMEYYNKFMK